MRSLAIVALVALAACKPSSSGETPRAAAVTPKDVTAAITGALEQWRQAYEVRSLETLGKSYAHDPDVIVVQEGLPMIGWSAVETMLKDRLAHTTAIRIRLKDVQIATLAPDVATMVAAINRELTDGATTVTEIGTLTLVFHKLADGWVIAVEHLSYRRAS